MSTTNTWWMFAPFCLLAFVITIVSVVVVTPVFLLYMYIYIIHAYKFKIWIYTQLIIKLLNRASSHARKHISMQLQCVMPFVSLDYYASLMCVVLLFSQNYRHTFVLSCLHLNDETWLLLLLLLLLGWVYIYLCYLFVYIILYK